MADIEIELQRDMTGLEQKTWNSATLEPVQTSKHALVFSIAEQNFAIAADFIEQIVELPKIADVPISGSTLLGLADHGGQPVPVVDIAPLLDVESGIEIFRHGLLLNHSGLKVMLAIEAVVVLRELSKDHNIDLPPKYQASEFADYACELTIASNYSPAGNTLDGLAADGCSDEPGKLTRKPVVVLNVSALLAAVHNAATARPAS